MTSDDDGADFQMDEEAVEVTEEVEIEEEVYTTEMVYATMVNGALDNRSFYVYMLKTQNKVLMLITNPKLYHICSHSNVSDIVC